MITKAEIKEINELHYPKFRQRYNKFIAEGYKVSIEFLKRRKFPIERIYVTESLGNDVQGFLRSTDSISLISEREMSQMSALTTSTPILLVLENKQQDIIEYTSKANKIIYLDAVQDPGNVGTIIRIADWFGIDTVIRSEESADFYSPKVVQATMGSLVNVNVYTERLENIVAPGLPIIGTFMEGSPIETVTLPKRGILLMGSEGRGIRQEWHALIDTKVSIPGSLSRVSDSLNVGIAAGIVCARW